MWYRCRTSRQLCLAWRRTGGEGVLSVGITTIDAAGDRREGSVNPESGDRSLPPTGFHLPVMIDEVLDGLSVAGGGVYLDGTLGEGGHSLAILRSGDGRSAKEDGAATGEHDGPSLVIGVDLDGRSISEASERLCDFGSRFQPVQGNYANMGVLAARFGVGQVDGVLLDLGFSSRQVDRPGYGLSFQEDEPLDMRYDGTQGVSAAELINTTSGQELGDMFRRYGEEPRARSMANAIVAERANRPISTTGELASLAERVMGRRRGYRIHPATRIFQALRIAVNAELENLRAGLEASIALLRPGGRLAVISYHSLEDRIVKNFMVHNSAECICPPGLPVCVCGQSPALTIVNRRIIRPSGEEVAFNPRSRSARLRLARRIQSGR